MEDKKQLEWVAGILFIGCLWWYFQADSNKDQLEMVREELHETQMQLSDAEYERDMYEEGLMQANYNIEDAQSYAWSSYDDMGYALDNLETVNP